MIKLRFSQKSFKTYLYTQYIWCNVEVFMSNFVFHFSSMLKVQRMISAGLDDLEYFTNNKFIFNAYNYNAALDRLNEVDKKIYYGRSSVCLNISDFFVSIVFNLSISFICFIRFIYAQMHVLEYCDACAYGYKIYLAKEKPENIPKARALYKRLWYLDVAVKTYLCYWIFKKVLAYFDITFY